MGQQSWALQEWGLLKVRMRNSDFESGGSVCVRHDMRSPVEIYGCHGKVLFEGSQHGTVTVSEGLAYISR